MQPAGLSLLLLCAAVPSLEGHDVTAKRGVCPLASGDQFAQCTVLCLKDEDCPGAGKCCSNGCGWVCLEPAQEKPGACPALSGRARGPCLTSCRTDLDCPAKKKCCTDGCARRCRSPVWGAEPPVAPPAVKGLRAGRVPYSAPYCPGAERGIAPPTVRGLSAVQRPLLPSGCSVAPPAASGQRRWGAPCWHVAGRGPAPPTPRPTPVGVPQGVCLLPRWPGPCLAFVLRFFYNPGSQRCERFIFGGCHGNGNNFETKEACLWACSRKPEDDPLEPAKVPKLPVLVTGPSILGAPGDGAGKPGACPEVPLGTAGNCMLRCRSDHDCKGSTKCCSNGCGLICKFPVFRE
ncbi:WAP four-disulfide core domain protein 3-like [Ornithorhynchus anatinus]|uniref:WAP four-disulfide core domain protein 3-like n=1 Tax=Ornithorhynchus anatinus TaxID=9258 RepID=UPI0019D4517E|nr:WAP four-disulfide core domain protein 3-like [Ornithorhynchus anatinus]